MLSSRHTVGTLPINPNKATEMALVYASSMGLEMVELTMEAEESFGIKIPDEALSNVRTVADFAAVIFSRLPADRRTLPSAEPCPTAHEFYQLRQYLVESVGLTQTRIRPTTRLADLFGKDLRTNWDALHLYRPNMPRLTVPDKLDGCLLLTTAVLILVMPLVVSLQWVLHGPWLGMPLAIFSLALLLALLKLPAYFFGTIPGELVTVSDLVRRLCLSEQRLDPTSPPLVLTQNDVLQEVRRITAEQFCLRLEEVHPQSDFVKDLGAG